jgi:hypothetical protein
MCCQCPILSLDGINGVSVSGEDTMAESIDEMQSSVNRVFVDVVQVFREGILSRNRHWLGLLGSWSCDS